MSDVLARILESKRREIEESRAKISLDEMRKLAHAAPVPRGFENAMRRKIERGLPAVIAEIKRSSPSRGAIRAALDPAKIAISYEQHGAACLSVLTDGPYFGGSSQDLREARAACSLPVLRKDFMLDPYQVYEARAWGADCILLIMDAAPDSRLQELEEISNELGMDVLVESHGEAQLQRAIEFRTSLIGINNRDLTSFETRLETTLFLVGKVPEGKILVTESGIETASDVQRLRSANVSAYLVGTAFMKAADPGSELARVFFEH